MEYILVPALLGLIPALIAHSKGRSMGAWWIYGALLFIIALPHSLLMGNRKEEEAREETKMATSQLRDCPFCAEPIKKIAIKCKHCGSAVEPIVEKTTLDRQEVAALVQKPASSGGTIVGLAIAGLFVIGIIGHAVWGDSPQPNAPTVDQMAFEKIQERIRADFESNKPDILAKGKKLLDEGRYSELVVSLDKYARVKDDDLKALRHEARMNLDYLSVKRIPASDIKRNVLGYERLVADYPDNKLFKEKYNYYKSKLNQ